MKLRVLKREAFTLIELSIVLIIIGIILASVMKGRDLIGSAQSKEVTQTFIQEWAIITNTYYSKTNQIMADGVENGGTATSSDGFFDDLGGAVTGANSWGKNFVEKLKEVGIDPCQLVRSDIKDANADVCSSGINPFKRNLKGEFVGKRASNVHFYSMTLNNKTQNVILFTNVPGDLAKAIDTIVDGVPDGQSGAIIGISKVKSTDIGTGTYPDTAGASQAIADWVAVEVDGTNTYYYYYTLVYIMED